MKVQEYFTTGNPETLGFTLDSPDVRNLSIQFSVAFRPTTQNPEICEKMRLHNLKEQSISIYILFSFKLGQM